MAAQTIEHGLTEAEAIELGLMAKQAIEQGPELPAIIWARAIGQGLEPAARLLEALSENGGVASR
jgi:hypothetical protein